MVKFFLSIASVIFCSVCYAQLFEFSDAKKLPSSINSSADEFRPIVIYNFEFDNHLMIFSSNRAGGMGGFDLYYTGIPELVRNPFIGD